MGKIAVIIIVAVVHITLITAKEEFQREKQFIKKINNAQSLWIAGENKITKNGIKYMKKILGTLLPKSQRSLPLNEDDNIIANIPKSFDARTQWPNCSTISQIKDQGNCGSCWAVAAASAASDRLCIQSGGETVVNLSALNLLSCCRSCVVSGGCDGGYPHEAWRYMKTTGLVTGGDYTLEEGCQPYHIVTSKSSKYNLHTPICNNNTCTNKNYKVPYLQDKHYGSTSYYLPKKVTAIQSDIIRNGPVEAAFYVFQDFMYYKTGIYQKTSNKQLGRHAVRIIGWGTENNVDYWLAANSWGTGWGESGTFKIIRGQNECSIENYVTAGKMKT